MQEILVDGGEFVLENDIEELDGLGIAGERGVGLGAGGFGLDYAASRTAFSSSISSIVSWHRPQFFLAPQRA
jgi:hypothetical protein